MLQSAWIACLALAQAPSAVGGLGLAELFDLLGQGRRSVESELRRRAAQGEEAWLTDEQWGRALLASEVLRVRSRWPRDEPFAIRLAHAPWLGAGIEVRPRDPKLTFAHLPWDPFPGFAAQRVARLGWLAPGRHVVRLNVLVGSGVGRPSGPHRQDTMHWNGWIDFGVEVVERGDVLRASNAAWLRNEVWSALRLARREFGLAVALVESARLRADGVALSVSLALLRDGAVVGRAEIEGRGGSCTILSRDDWSCPGPWSLRVCGIAGDTHLDWNASRRFGGTFEVPVGVGVDHRWRRAGEG